MSILQKSAQSASETKILFDKFRKDLRFRESQSPSYSFNRLTAKFKPEFIGDGVKEHLMKIYQNEAYQFIIFQLFNKAHLM